MIESKNNWKSRTKKRIILFDLLALICATSLGLFFRFPNILVEDFTYFEKLYLILSIIIIMIWLIVLDFNGSREINILGFGADEYKKVANSVFITFSIVALFSYLFKLEISRGYVFITFPLGLLLLFIFRRYLRKILYNQRISGVANFNVLLISALENDPVINRLQSSPYSGLKINKIIDDSKMTIDSIIHEATQLECDVILIGQSSNLSAQKLRELGWLLEGKSIDLIVAPSVTEIAGPRLKVSNVEGLPLLHLDQPDFRGPKRFAKRILDILISFIGLVLLIPIYLIFGIFIKIEDKGPIIFRQNRLGKNGKTFNVLKFRTMYVDAHRQRENVMLETNKDMRLPKHPDDPRVTKIGKFLRRWSIDELPQLVNVLKGEMSLVGPRPPLKEEVNQYEKFENRRLLVKPGLTGLWQVSGRSELSWEDTVRLDLYYVENWSLTLDLLIIMRTAAAVWRGEGAY